VSGQRRTVELRDHQGARVVVDRPRARGHRPDEIVLLGALADDDRDEQITALCEEYLAHRRSAITLARSGRLVPAPQPLLGARVLAEVDALLFRSGLNHATEPGEQLALEYEENAA
jgi:hypothetical protein